MYSIISHKIKKLKEARNGSLMPNDYETISILYKVSEKNVRFIEEHPEFTRYKKLDELKALIAKDVFSIRKEECLDLPPKVYEKLYVDMSPEQRRVYQDLKTQLMAEYEDKTLTLINKVSLTLRLMQVVGGFFPYLKEVEKIKGSEKYIELVGEGQLIGKSNPKIEALIADLEELNEDARVIVWAHFVPELKMLYEVLKKLYPTCLYFGGTPDIRRKAIIEEFKAGKYKIFVGNAQTAGFGLNLQNATYQYFYSNTFRVEERLQAEDRSHRIGVKGTVVYKDIIIKNSIDEKIFANISTGRDLNDFFKRTSLTDLLTDDEA